MARQKTVIDKLYCSPGDVIPCGLNWGPWLGVTADTIYDFDGTVTGLDVKDSWFANTYTNLKVGPVPRGRYTVNFDIVGESGEEYHRELIIICR
jgi:hypothetical protein